MSKISMVTLAIGMTDIHNNVAAMTMMTSQQRTTAVPVEEELGLVMSGPKSMSNKFLMELILGLPSKMESSSLTKLNSLGALMNGKLLTTEMQRVTLETGTMLMMARAGLRTTTL